MLATHLDTLGQIELGLEVGRPGVRIDRQDAGPGDIKRLRELG